MDVVLLIGRILLAAIFLSSAIGHFRNTDAMAGYAASKGVSQARNGVLLTGVLALLGSVSIILGIWIDLGALLLVAFLIPVTFMMHAFWTQSDPQARQSEKIMFHKNLGLLGGALILFWAAHVAGDLPLTITRSLF